MTHQQINAAIQAKENFQRQVIQSVLESALNILSFFETESALEPDCGVIQLPVDMAQHIAGKRSA